MPYRVVGINTGSEFGDFSKNSNRQQNHLINDITSDKYLQINSCGIFENIKSNVTKYPNGRQDYQILFVERGGIIMYAPDGDISLSAGDMILIPPNIRSGYQYLPGCDAVWVHFTGQGVHELLERFAITSYVKYTVCDTKPFRILIEKIIREYQLRCVEFESVSCAYFVQFLAHAKRRLAASTPDQQTEQADLSPAINDMQTNFSQKRKISDYAKMCNISSSYFIAIFTSKYDMSPYRYLTEIRISQAKQLLLETNISISEVAHSIGYADQFYFLRIFRKYVGMSPSEFR